jgi:hypothetical protein
LNCLEPAIARGKVYLGQAQRTSAMNKLTYGIVRHQPRKVVHVVRNVGEEVAAWEIDQIIETVRERMLSRHGEQTAAVVFVQGMRETLRLFGDSYAVSLVRAAMFNAAVSWSPMSLD